MINGFDSYKLSINNLNDVNADSVNSNSEYTTSLYINGQLINFSSYVTNSYLSTTLSDYITSSFLTSTLSSYVLSTSLSSTLNNYATTAALSSYRLISDSYNKSETQDVANNAASSAVAVALTSSGAVALAIAANNIPVYAAIATAQATADGAAASATTANNNATDAQGRCSTLEGKTQNQTATAGNTNFTGVLNMTNGVNNNVTLNQTGDISCLTETLNTLTCNTELKGNAKLNLINQAQNHVLDGASIALSHSGGVVNCYSNLNVSNGANNNIVLNTNGDITCLTETLNTLTCNTELKGNGKLNLTNTTQDHSLIGNSITLSQSGKNTTIYGNSYIGASSSTVQLYGSNININNTNSVTELNTVTIGGLVQTVNLNGFVFVNGKLLQPFQTGPAGGQWFFSN